jgi:hypothetical protein
MIRVGKKEIVLDDLVFYMDPKNTKCYVPSGTSITDISKYASKGLFSNFDTNANYDPNDGGGSIIFDGVDDIIYVTTYGDYTALYLTPDTYNFTDEVTLEAFVKPSSFVGNPNIVGKGANLGYRCRFTTDSRFWLYSASGATINNIETAADLIKVNTWVHVVAVFSQAGLRAYVNGVLEASNSQPFMPDPLNSCILHLGMFCGSGENFSGKFGITRVYHKAFTADEVLKNFNADRQRYGI